MQWIKRGLIYCANGKSDWSQSHAALPTPYQISDSLLRIYRAFRATKNVGRIGFVDVQIDNPKEIVGVSRSPILDIGPPGSFDYNGVAPVSIVKHENKVYLYYVGFQLSVNIPYYLFSGLAISTDNGDSFSRLSQSSILEPNKTETTFRTAPHVIKDGAIWKMWYVAGSSWTEYQGKKLPFYGIKYLTSKDGTSWGSEGIDCFQPQGDEHGFGRPHVIKDKSEYKMYYSIRSFSKGYRLGYAESADGINWLRKDDQMGLDVSLDGWDSNAVCYSSIINCNGKVYLFYNGNGFGETGFGYAELII